MQESHVFLCLDTHILSLSPGLAPQVNGLRTGPVRRTGQSPAAAAAAAACPASIHPRRWRAANGIHH